MSYLQITYLYLPTPLQTKLKQPFWTKFTGTPENIKHNILAAGNSLGNGTRQTY